MKVGDKSIDGRTLIILVTAAEAAISQTPVSKDGAVFVRAAIRNVWRALEGVRFDLAENRTEDDGSTLPVEDPPMGTEPE